MRIIGDAGATVNEHDTAARNFQETAMSTNKPASTAIVMGSDSDWTVMKSCVETLRQFKIPCQVRILSAHRTPQAACEFAQQARDNGIEVIIAAAGMAAHLAGVLAAHTTLPVIGVPMASGTLQGIDALLSTVQMPPGVPVATVGIGAAGAKNAAILAAQILALKEKKMAERLAQYKTEMADSIREKNEKLQQELG
jgi:phosphoribosylaminoimidazole carboxylase PurE protein